MGNAEDDLSRRIREASFTVADVLTERDQAKWKSVIDVMRGLAVECTDGVRVRY